MLRVRKESEEKIPIANIESVSVESGIDYSASLSAALAVPAGTYTLFLNYTGEDFSFSDEHPIIVSNELAAIVNVVAWVIIFLTAVLVVIAVIKAYKEGRRIITGPSWRYKGL